MRPWLLFFALPSPGPPAVEIEGDLDPRELARWQNACTTIAEKLPGAGVLRVQIQSAPSIDAFVKLTGRSRFEAAALVDEIIWVQPKEVLDRFGDLDAIRRHECVHARLRQLRVPPLPRVVEEAVAIGLAGQRVPPALPLTDAERPAAEAILLRPTDRTAFEQALARAHATVWPKLPKGDPAALVRALRRGD